jgi:hypothetical protein
MNFIAEARQSFFVACTDFIDYTDNLFVDVRSYTKILYSPISTVAIATHRDEAQVFLLFGFLIAIVSGILISLNRSPT